MFKSGMSIATITEKMKRLSWFKLAKRIDFESGATNLIYNNDNNDTLCFYFDENKRLIDVL